MKNRSRILASALVICHSPQSNAAEYTWTNMTANGSLGSSSGYDIAASGNWNSAPVFDSTTTLNLLNAVGSYTLYAGSTTRTLNSIVAGAASTDSLRINSGSSTLSFTGTNPSINVQSGTLRLEVKLSNSVGLTKTGEGTIFSNLQSASAGFSGNFNIAQGMVRAGNNFALGDQKTVNISSGGSLDLNAQLLGSSAISGGSTVSRNYSFSIAGTGSNGLGAIQNGNASGILGGLSGIHNLTLTANAAVGGSGRFDIGTGGGTILGGGHTLTKLGANEIWLRGAASNINHLVSAGTLVISDNDAALGGSTGTVEVSASASLASSGDRTIATPVTLRSGSNLVNRTGTVNWSGNFSLSDAAGTLPVITAISSPSTSISGVIDGAGGFQKSGSNTLTLTRANTYQGQTYISQGILALGSNASIASSERITLASGATFNVSTVNGGYTLGADQTLDGSGTIVGNTTIAGTHSPGFSPGTQSFSNNLTYTTGSSITWELIDNSIANRGTSYDAINVTGNLSFSAPTTLNLDFSILGSAVNWENSFWSNNVVGASGWKIFDVDGSISGFQNLQIASTNWLDGGDTSLSSIRPGGHFSLFQGAEGIYLNYAVPEPATALLSALGSLALLRRRR
jgi:fibronectin-binding autotransporter adhesin